MDLRKRLADKGWLLAVIWLVFLIFPIIGIWTRDLSTGRRVGAVAALIVFTAIYVNGFRLIGRREAAQAAGQVVEGLPPHGPPYFAALLAAVAVAWGLAGASALQAMPFVVSFAVFHFAWRIVIPVTLASLAIAIVGPWYVDELRIGLIAGAIVAGVALATMMIRVFDEHEQEQVLLRTDLAVTEERERLGRDVHDVVGHNLTATIVKVELARRLLDGVSADTPDGQARLDRGRNELADLETVSRRALAEIRATIGGTRTADLDDELNAAKAVLADAGVELVVTGDREMIPKRHRQTVAWVVREGVTNIVRHARASQCRVELAPEGNVLLRVADDGIGISGPEGSGLSGLRERLAAADLELQTGPTQNNSTQNNSNPTGPTQNNSTQTGPESSTASGTELTVTNGSIK